MPKIRISLGGSPLLNVASYARQGPGRRDRLSAAELQLIARTVGRTPEVMVKVLAKDSNSLKSVARHVGYIGRYGALELETEEGERLQGREAGQDLVKDWDLDLDEERRDVTLTGTEGRVPKLVHKIMLSMPPGTPAKGVLEATRNFAREEFALKHRYALVLHTDEPHPHVHLVVKAVSERGERLNIRKATLREWRREFARHLRNQGIAANATERAVRGQSRPHKKDGIYRASLRGESRHMQGRVHSGASDIARGSLGSEAGKDTLMDTRRHINGGWRALRDLAMSQRHPVLAAQIDTFINQMPPPTTEREELANALRLRMAKQREREVSRTR